MKDVIRFIKAERTGPHNVAVLYTVNNVPFTVEWNNVHPATGEQVDYDLNIHAKSPDLLLAEQVSDAIREGETDQNPDLDLYLFVRDTFNKNDCLDI